MYEYAAALVKVIDADTLRLDVDLGFHIHVFATVRLARVDAPERGTIAGMITTAFVQKELATVDQLHIISQRSEKYGRWLAEVNYTELGTPQTWHNLSDVLISTNHAKPYTGGRR